jgi:hypothetical protein
MSILYGYDGQIINLFSIKNLAESISYFATLGFVKGSGTHTEKLYIENRREGSDTEGR